MALATQQNWKTETELRQINGRKLNATRRNLLYGIIKYLNVAQPTVIVTANIRNNFPGYDHSDYGAVIYSLSSRGVLYKSSSQPASDGVWLVDSDKFLKYQMFSPDIR